MRKSAIFLTIFTLFAAASAYGKEQFTCKGKLVRNHNGKSLGSWDASGDDENSACTSAKNICESERTKLRFKRTAHCETEVTYRPKNNDRDRDRDRDRNRDRDGHRHDRRGNDGLREASNACNQLYYESDKQSCWSMVSSSYYFSVPAVNACMKLYYDSDKKSCLSGIANQDIRDYEAANCSSLYYDSQKKSCLLNIRRRA